MQVTSTTNNGATSYTDNYTPATPPSQALGTSDFLQLLSTQMGNQDPLQPTDNTQMLAQLAQFTSLQEMNSLTSQISQMRSDQQKMTATTYLGKSVTMADSQGQPVTGIVTAVNTSSDTPQLQVGNASYPLSALLSVTGATVGAPNNQPAA